MWAIGEPSGPIENGTTYIVRPFIEPAKRPLELLPHLRRLGPVVGRAGVLLALGADEGPVLDPGDVAGVGEGQVGVRALGVGEALEGARPRPAPGRGGRTPRPSRRTSGSRRAGSARRSPRPRKRAWHAWAVRRGSRGGLAQGGSHCSFSGCVPDISPLSQEPFCRTVLLRRASGSTSRSCAIRRYFDAAAGRRTRRRRRELRIFRSPFAVRRSATVTTQSNVAPRLRPSTPRRAVDRRDR